MLAVVALLLLGGGAVVTYTMVGSDSAPSTSKQQNTSKQKNPSVAARVQSVEAPVSKAQQHFVGTVGAMSPSGAGLARMRPAARAFDTAVQDGQALAGGLIASSPSDRADIAAVNKLLSAQAALASYLLTAPTTVEGFTQTFTAPITAKTAAVNSAAAALGRLVPRAQPSTIDPGTWVKLDQVVAEGANRAQVRTFVTKMENLLAQSATGRAQIVSALYQTQDDCAISPDQGAQQLRQVADNRQSLLDQASAMTVPQSAAVRNVLSLFQQALRHSIAADDAYASWMVYLYDYYYSYPVGCLGTVPTDTNYQRALGEDQLATSAKTQLARAFNRLARQYGLRANWTASGI